MSIQSKEVETWRGYLSRIDDLVSDMKTARRDGELTKVEVDEALKELDRFRDYVMWKSNWADQPVWYGRD